ncbi:MAG: signal recognition particle-docking protein FtsY [Pseudomonadota bacterium]
MSFFDRLFRRSPKPASTPIPEAASDDAINVISTIETSELADHTSDASSSQDIPEKSPSPQLPPLSVPATNVVHTPSIIEENTYPAVEPASTPGQSNINKLDLSASHTEIMMVPGAPLAHSSETSNTLDPNTPLSTPDQHLTTAVEFSSPQSTEQPTALSWREKLKAGLKKTRTRLTFSLSKLLKGRKLDADLLEELETLLLTSDVGVKATEALLEDLQVRYKAAGAEADAYQLLQQSLITLLQPLQASLETSSHKPFVIMLAGVNGAGKTTSIGKLAHYFQQQGKTVLLAAGDTFRAAAREQLTAWGERNQVAVISQQGSDPAAVIFDAVQAAQARDIDIVLADTAGRLGTQPHLMEELKKIKRVIGKADATAPHEVLLVLDANTGQNALNQLSAFDEAIGVTGLVLSKLDGSAKGGVIAAIAKAQPRPIRFIGIGEGVDDLRPFEAAAFVEALFDETED